MDLQQLKDIATRLGFTFHHLVGAEKLEAQLREYCESNNTTLEDVMEKLGNGEEVVFQKVIPKEEKVTFASLAAIKNAKKKETLERDAMKLVRCIITCNNKNKTSYSGEIFEVRNAVIPGMKKFVPFDVPTHIPQIMFNMLKERKCQIFVSKRVDGRDVNVPKEINEFNIEVLPPLTPEELEAIRQKQLAEGKQRDN